MTPQKKTSQTTSNAEPEEVCPICGGMGLVKKQVPVDHPDFGKAFVCVCQQEKLATRRAQQIYEMSNLDSYDHLTFANFQTNLEWLSPEENNLLRMAAELTHYFAQQPDGQWLLLQGGYGSGKTHLAAAIGNHRLAMEKSVIFMTVPDLLDHLRRTYGPGTDVRYDQLFDQLKQTPLLILDDLGSESPTAWANEKVFQLLNERYVNVLPTVITTNHSLEDLDKRISSRLVDQHLTRIIRLDLPDYRRGGEMQNRSDLSNLRLYADMTFETFDRRRNALPADVADNLERALRLAENFANHPHGWLVLLGEHGAGKTHLAASIANYRQMMGDDVILVTTADLLDYLRSAFNPASRDNLDTRFNEIRNAPLLILDHFQLATATAWAKEKLFQILDYRYLAKLPTVITKAGDDINDLEASFRSRLLDTRISRIFFITAPDYRGGASARRNR
jgi:DNA replication protein DnaC